MRAMTLCLVLLVRHPVVRRLRATRKRRKIGSDVTVVGKLRALDGDCEANGGQRQLQRALEFGKYISSSNPALSCQVLFTSFKSFSSEAMLRRYPLWHLKPPAGNPLFSVVAILPQHLPHSLSSCATCSNRHVFPCSHDHCHYLIVIYTPLLLHHVVLLYSNMFSSFNIFDSSHRRLQNQPTCLTATHQQTKSTNSSASHSGPAPPTASPVP